MKLVAFVLVIVIAIAGVFIYAGTKDETLKHHTIEEVMEDVDGSN